MPEAKKGKVVVEMDSNAGKVCKTSVRYATTQAGVPADNIYVKNTFMNPMPSKVRVTIEAIE